MNSSSLRIAIVLGFGLVAISFGSILVRFSQEAPSLTIAFYRLAVATLLLGPFYLKARRSGGRLGSMWLIAASGLALAMHFAFWFASLRYTSVAVSILLVYTAPAPVALISYFWFGERLTRAGVAGMALTFTGSSLLVLNDLGLRGDWRGALLALAGGLAFAVYLVLGRRLRQGRSLLEYVVPTYAAAAVVLAALVLLAGVPATGFRPETYWAMFLLALFPQCLGHTSYNWALRFLSATLVSMLALAEPIVASALAYWILGEPVTGLVYLGGLLVGLGIYLVATRGTRPGDAVDVAVAVIVREGRVWVQRRREDGALDGLWEYPGGKAERGEEPLPALLRELREEAGLSLKPGDCDLLRTVEHDYPGRRVRLHFFLCRTDKDPIAREGRWAPVEELGDLPMPAANASVNEALRRNLSGSGDGC